MEDRKMSQRFRTTSLIALPLALMALAPAAHALSMTASNNWAYNGAPLPGVPLDVSGPASSGSVNVLAFDSDPGNSANSVFYHTYGDDTGNFGSRSSGTGNFYITGEYKFHEAYTASGGGTDTFNFHVVPGELATYSAPLTGAEMLLGKYNLEILLNGASIWSSYAALATTSSGTTLTQSGASLGGTLTGSQYSWADYTNSLLLSSFATLNAGDSYTIDYRLTTTASGNLICTGSPSNTGGGGATDPVGGGVKPNPDSSNGNANPCGGAVARIGDPFGVRDVPEPSTVALLGLGLVGFGITRRRKA